MVQVHPGPLSFGQVRAAVGRLALLWCRGGAALGPRVDAHPTRRRRRRSDPGAGSMGSRERHRPDRPGSRRHGRRSSGCAGDQHRPRRRGRGRSPGRRHAAIRSAPRARVSARAARGCSGTAATAWKVGPGTACRQAPAACEKFLHPVEEPVTADLVLGGAAVLAGVAVIRRPSSRVARPAAITRRSLPRYRSSICTSTPRTARTWSSDSRVSGVRPTNRARETVRTCSVIT